VVRQEEGPTRKKLTLPEGWWRPVVALVVFFAIWGAANALLFDWMRTWGSTPQEARSAYPYDELTPRAADRMTWAITIDAPPERVWPWLIQMGQDRAAFYTNDWMENLVGVNYHNADDIEPRWQYLRTGDRVRVLPQGYLGLPLSDTESSFLVTRIDSPTALVLRGFGGWTLEPRDGGTRTRLVYRMAPGDDPLVTRWERINASAFHLPFGKQHLLGIKARAEGRLLSPRELTTAADIGWLIGFFATTLLAFRARHNGWVGLLPGSIWAVLVAGSTADIRSAAAAYLMLGVPIVGAMLAPKGWKLAAPLAAITGYMVVIVLTDDAWIGFGVVGLVGGIASIVLALTRDGWPVAEEKY
jgi:uncharacterized protein YndB with AHSA1/START domain